MEQRYRLPKGKVTVKGLLTLSGVNSMLEEVSRDGDKIDHCVVAYIRKNGSINCLAYRADSAVVVYMIESVKKFVLQADWGE